MRKVPPHMASYQKAEGDILVPIPNRTWKEFEIKEVKKRISCGLMTNRPSSANLSEWPWNQGKVKWQFSFYLLLLRLYIAFIAQSFGT